MSKEEPAPPAVSVAHADGMLTLTEDAVEVEVTRGRGYRGTITVPRTCCTLRIMGRAIGVYDEGRLVHLCSRCKPTAEVARLAAELGDRATSEQRTSFATLLALREESAAYRPPGAEIASAPEAETAPETELKLEVPAGHEALRRVYISQVAMERDSRRLRAAGWIELERVAAPAEASAPTSRSRLRGLLRAADPSREPSESTVIWIRPIDRDGMSTA